MPKMNKNKDKSAWTIFFTGILNTGHKPCLHDKELGIVSYNSTTDPQS